MHHQRKHCGHTTNPLVSMLLTFVANLLYIFFQQHHLVHYLTVFSLSLSVISNSDFATKSDVSTPVAPFKSALFAWLGIIQLLHFYYSVHTVWENIGSFYIISILCLFYLASY